MRHPLRNQILLPFAALTTTAVVAVSVVGAWRAGGAVDRNIEAHVGNAVEVLLAADFPLTDAVLHQTQGLSGAEFICTDAAGELVASSLPAAAPGFREVAALPQSNDSDSLRPARSGNSVVVARAEYLHWRAVRAPRHAADAPRVLHVLYPQSLRKQLLREAVVPPLAVGGVSAIAAFALSYFLAARICRPIAAVREQLQKISSGDYEPIAAPRRDDEVRDLVASANVLARRLADRELAVQRSARATLLGQLSGGLCHHLRNSATGAKLAVQLHRRRCGDDDESLDVALRQLEFAEQYVQRLLTLGKPRPPQMARLDSREVAAEALALVEPTLKHRGIELRTSPASLVKGGGVEAADRELVRQLLVNLLLNAVDAAGERGWIELRVDFTDDEVRLAVLDGGPGPSPEMVGRLFEPFATTKPDGVGLGLAAARHIAELHGGRIQFTPRPHTCFEFVLPRRMPADAEPTLASDAEMPVAAPCRQGEIELA